MVSVETISIVFTGLSVSLAAFYYISRLRNAQRTQQLQLETRQAQLFMQIYSRFDDPSWMQNYVEVVRWDFTDYEDWLEKYSPEVDPKSATKYGSLMAYFEGIGVLVDQDFIDADFVSRLLSSNLINIWEKMGPIIKERRKFMNNPFIWEYVEWLYNRVKKDRLTRQPKYLSTRN
jgi:hypothetical protein